MFIVSSFFSVQFLNQFLGWKLLCIKAFSSVLFLVSSIVSGKKRLKFPTNCFDVFKVNLKSLAGKGIARQCSFQLSFQTLLQFPEPLSLITSSVQRNLVKFPETPLPTGERVTLSLLSPRRQGYSFLFHSPTNQNQGGKL